MLNKLGIHSITLDLPFRLNHVNCFLAEGEKGMLLIDAGLNNQETQKRWNQELKGIDLKEIIVTHHHPDHIGAAGYLQQRYKTTVSMGKIEEELALSHMNDLAIKQLPEYYYKSAVPEEKGKEMIKNTKEFIPIVTPYPQVTDYITESKEYKIGNEIYKPFILPGHSDGLITFYNEEQKVLISTDHILPRITPNISYWYQGDPNPLGSYFNSLNRMKELEIDYVIPSHGGPFYDGTKRIHELIAHHEERCDFILSILSTSKLNVYQIAKGLFPFELTVHELRFAIGETVAHLEYLRRRGDCKRETDAGQWLYYL